MKSIFKLKPEDTTDKGASFGKYKKFMVSGVREMAKSNNRPDLATWFFLDLKHDFPSSTADEKKLGTPLWVCGNESKWKKHFSEAVRDLKRVAMGTCYVESNASGNPVAIVLQIAKGKARNKEILKKFRTVTKKLNIPVRISRGPEAQEDPETDGESSQADDLEMLQGDILDLVDELGKLAKPISGKQLPQAEELKQALSKFTAAMGEVKDSKIRQEFASFATQVASWQKQLQAQLEKAAADAAKQADKTKVKGAFPQLWTRIEKIYTTDLQKGAAWANTPASKATVQKTMELRQAAQQLSNEYQKMDAAKQNSVRDKMSQARDWTQRAMEFLRQQPQDALQSANAGAKAQAAQVVAKLRTAIMGATKRINLNDGLQVEETANAQKLQKGIEDFRIALQNAPAETQKEQMGFFEQVKKLRNKLTLEMGKLQTQAQADMPKLLEKQQQDLQRAEALAQELDIFNLKP